MVCIIDDREDVWDYALNLIHVKPYHFFQHTGDINAPPNLQKNVDVTSQQDNRVNFTHLVQGKSKDKLFFFTCYLIIKLFKFINVYYIIPISYYLLLYILFKHIKNANY